MLVGAVFAGVTLGCGGASGDTGGTSQRVVEGLTARGAGTSASTPTRWRLIDLGTLGGSNSWAAAINERGQMVGVSDTKAGGRHAFLWSRGRMIDLGTLGGPKSNAYALNDRGQVVGWSSTAARKQHAFLWKNGKMVDLGKQGISEAVAINDKGQIIGHRRARQHSSPRALMWQGDSETALGTLGGKQSSPAAINERGQIVGESTTASREHHAFMWQNGKMTDLGTLRRPFAWSRALALNERGQIVGESSERAVLWQDGKAINLVGRMGWEWSVAEAINERGQVAGSRGTSGGYVPAFLWQNGKVTDLNTRPGGDFGATCFEVPNAINDRGQMAFTAIANDQGDCHAFVWQNGKMTDLGTAGGSESWAVGINGRGEIVGGSWAKNRGSHAVLWTPRPGS